jgi:hypothetical protein
MLRRKSGTAPPFEAAPFPEVLWAPIIRPPGIRQLDKDPRPPWRQRASCAAVVGSITRLASVILLAGKPLISACFLISAASVAR